MGDVQLLASHFLEQAAVGVETGVLRMTREVTDALNRYSFPGNVRELENAIRRAVAVCSSGIITLECLPPEIAESAQAGSSPKIHETELALVADRPTMDELQRRYLQFILDENDGNRRRAATALGLDRRTVQRLIARYQLRAQADVEAVGESDTNPSNESDMPPESTR